jgi:hypothetical protein
MGDNEEGGKSDTLDKENEGDNEDENGNGSTSGNNLVVVATAVVGECCSSCQHFEQNDGTSCSYIDNFELFDVNLVVASNQST